MMMQALPRLSLSLARPPRAAPKSRHRLSHICRICPFFCSISSAIAFFRFARALAALPRAQPAAAAAHRASARRLMQAVLTMAQLLGVVTMALVSAGAPAAAPATLHDDGCLVLRDPSAPHDVKLEAWGPNAVRVRIVPAGGTFRDDLVSALVPRAADTVTECATVNLGAQSAQAVTSGNMRVEVDADGLLSFTRVSDSALLLAEKAMRWLGPAVSTPPVPGAWLGLNMTFKATPGERFYGLGQHKTGQLDNAGLSFDLTPRNTEILIPVAHSSLGYSILVNLPGFGTVDFAEEGIAWNLQTVLQADFWVATTAAPSGAAAAVSPWAQLQAAFANATGHAPVYPEWASGYWQCKNRYHNQTQVMDIARGYTQRGYPIALLIIDYFSWAPGPLGDETLPAECWPDPAGMVAELKQMGIELMLSPYFHSVTGQSKNYPKADAQGLLVDGAAGKPTDIAYGGAYLYDLFQPAARAYAWNAVESGYVKPYGLHHWWLDCDEPCGGDMTQLIYRNGTWPASFVGAAYPVRKAESYRITAKCIIIARFVC
jgi:alpha-D-xyloside xylohydrolase